MGCESSRDHHPEDAIEANEKLMGFSEMTVSQAFFNLNTKEIIEEKKVKKALDVLNINLSEQDNKNFLFPFLELFELKDEEGKHFDPKVYNFPAFVTTLILMTKSNTKEKAKAIFRVHDHDCAGVLSKEAAEHILRTIFEEVRRYSELFSELDSFKISAQATKVTDQINKLVGHRLKYLLDEKDNLTEEHFIERWAKLDRSEEEQALAPVTSFDRIRRTVMDYVFEKTSSLKNIGEQ